MNLIWKQVAFARGETPVFNNIKLGIIRQKGSGMAAYVDKRKIEDSKSKKEALKRILKRVDTTKGFQEKVQARGDCERENACYHQAGKKMPCRE